MQRLLQISRDPQLFASVTRKVSIGTVIGFVAVVALLLGRAF